MADIQTITGLKGTGDGGDGPVPKQAIIGNVVFVAMVGMALGLLGNEMATLQDWNGAITPAFVGKSCIHLGTVIGAYVGGRLIPTGR